MITRNAALGNAACVETLEKCVFVIHLPIAPEHLFKFASWLGSARESGWCHSSGAAFTGVLM